MCFFPDKLAIFLTDPGYNVSLHYILAAFKICFFIFGFLVLAVLCLFCSGSFSFFYHWVDICHETEEVSAMISLICFLP